MEFSEFSEIIAQWHELRPEIPLDCWIDDANARLASIGPGVRCTMDLLNPSDCKDPLKLRALMSQGGASVACACAGALGIDPDTQCAVLVSWQAYPCSPADLLNRLENLANHRGALLSMMKTTLRTATPSPLGRNTINIR